MKVSPSRSVAENLLRLRRLRRVGLRELATESGVAIGALSRLESGLGNPRLETIAAVADALEVSIEELFSRADPGVHIVRGRDMQRRHRFGLTTFTAGHLTAGNTDLELAFMRLGRPEPSMAGEGVIEHLLVVAGEVEVRLEEELITVREGDYLKLHADAPHRYRAAGALARAILVTERRG